MSIRSNDQGRAYEYAWINTLQEALQPAGATRIVRNSSLDANRRAWESVSRDAQELFTLSATAALDTVLELEPRLCEDREAPLLLEFQRDGAGVKGDVRDIVIKRDDISWEIGLSIKHNHDAIKHSRLSHSLDFGNEWFDLPCSREYWNAVQPIFDRLKQEKARGTSWSALHDKKTGIYVPLLQAFMDEVLRADNADAHVPRKMVEYLIGTRDYYKVVSRDAKRLTLIHTFNVHGTLNQPGKLRVSAISVPTVKLPTELIALRFKPNCTNTIEMYLNHGWQLSFRIHNASSKVEPSLKFDVQCISMPVSVLNIECRWK